MVVRRSNGEEQVVGSGQTASSLPSALHLRFLTELHQLESVTSTQQLLAELEQVKKFAFEHNQGLAEVQGEVARQRRLLEMQEGEDRVTQRQQQLQEMYTEKLAALLQSQSEATKVTSDVARQLAKMTSEGQAGPVVRELQGLVEKLQRADEVPASRSSVLATTTKSTSTSISRTVEQESEVNGQFEDSKEESKSLSRDDMDRGSSSSIQVFFLVGRHGMNHLVFRWTQCLLVPRHLPQFWRCWIRIRQLAVLSRGQYLRLLHPFLRATSALGLK